MIILRLQGGMGNQMFMYAFAYSLQKKTGDKIYISTYAYRHMKESDTPRNYALHVFRMNKNVLILPRGIDNILEWIYQWRKECFQRKNPSLIINNEKNFLQATKSGLFHSSDMFRFYRKFSKRAKIKFIDGYFMSWKYFDAYSEEIKRGYECLAESSIQNKKIKEEIEMVNAVCVHVRLGDYLSKEFKHKNYVCREEYYLKAMEIIAEKQKDAIFYIFSTSKEDIEYIKKNYRFKYPVRYIELENPDYEEMRLMASCRHFIVSNSSFSWWAQYLCKNKDKIVVAPSRWVTDRKQYVKDIYMDGWEIVEV